MKNYYMKVIPTLTVLTIGAVLMSALSFPVHVSALTAPTVVDYNQSNWSDLNNSAEVTGTITWKAGDVIVVIGGAAAGTLLLNLPTATGLTFATTTSTGVGDSNNTSFYAWSATAASDGSSAVTSTRLDSQGFQMLGISVWVYRGSGGIGNSSTLSASTATTISLTRGSGNSAVVVGLGDWNAVATTTPTTPSPSSGGTQRVAAWVNIQATDFALDWTDQGTGGTTSYGITGGGFGSALKMSGVVVEITGSTPAGTARVIRLLGGIRLRGGVRLL